MCIPIFANSSRFIIQKRDNTIEYVAINKGVSNWLDFIYRSETIFKHGKSKSLGM